MIPAGLPTVKPVRSSDLAWVDSAPHVPMMVVIQAICARIGRITGLGIAGNVRRLYPKWLLTECRCADLCQHLQYRRRSGAMAETAGSCSRPHRVELLALFATLRRRPDFHASQTLCRRFEVADAVVVRLFAVLCIVHVRWSQLLRGLHWPRFTQDHRSGSRLSRYSARPSARIYFSGKLRKRSKTLKLNRYESRFAQWRE